MNLMHDNVTCPKFTTKPRLHQIILILWHVTRAYSSHYFVRGKIYMFLL